MKNLFLIGYRGTGKTILGKAVAKKLGKKFIDVDDVIVEISNKKIPEIFCADGEEKFRELETEALKNSCSVNGCVISCGGGIITQERNFNFLKSGIVCLLKADSKTIYDRIFKDENRPPLTDKNPYEEIEHLLEKRKELYEKAKDFKIDTANNSFNECVKKIIKEYNEKK